MKWWRRNIFFVLYCITMYKTFFKYVKKSIIVNIYYGNMKHLYCGPFFSHYPQPYTLFLKKCLFNLYIDLFI